MACLIGGSPTSTLSLLLYVVSITTVVSSTTTAEVPRQEDGSSGQVDLKALRLNTVAVETRLRNFSVAASKVAPRTLLLDGRLGVAVTVFVGVISVLGIKDAEKTMTSNVYIEVSWTDTELSWNSSEYEGVDLVEMPASAVWTPHVYIINSLDKGLLIKDTSIVDIYPDGSLSTSMDVIVETLCDMDLSRYPYDTQRCSLVFHTMYSTEVTMRVQSYYIMAWSAVLTYRGEWVMEAQYKEDIDVHSDIIPIVTVRMRRKTVFYTACVVLPMVLTSFMNTLVFLVPVQSGEKISYLVSIFVSTSVFTSFFTNVMPRGLDSVPSTIKLLIGVIVQSFVVLLATLFVMARETRARNDTEAGGNSVQGRDVGDSDIVRLPTSKENLVYSSNAIPIYSAMENPTHFTKENPTPNAIFGSMMKHIEKVRIGCIRLTTLSLDHIMFSLALFANVIFLLSLLFEVL